MTQETATTREGLLHEIIERELVMFLATPNEGGVAQCQMHPDAFRTMRRMTHCIHDDATLVSYLHDLRLAAETGRNFMIEKYARMDDRLPPLSSSPLLDEIADAETAFLEEAAAKTSSAATCAANSKPSPTPRWNFTPRKSAAPGPKAATLPKNATARFSAFSAREPSKSAKPRLSNT